MVVIVMTARHLRLSAGESGAKGTLRRNAPIGDRLHTERRRVMPSGRFAADGQMHRRNAASKKESPAKVRQTMALGGRSPPGTITEAVGDNHVPRHTVATPSLHLSES